MENIIIIKDFEIEPGISNLINEANLINKRMDSPEEFSLIKYYQKHQGTWHKEFHLKLGDDFWGTGTNGIYEDLKNYIETWGLLYLGDYYDQK